MSTANATAEQSLSLPRLVNDVASPFVIPECREPHAASYLGHHFSSFDIPQQARTHYLKNWMRLIVDASLRPGAGLAATDGPGSAEVDLSHCGLRRVSPVHIEYLRNMGVAGPMSISIASMSISIIGGGRSWGLFACHNAHPKKCPARYTGRREFLRAGILAADAISGAGRCGGDAERARFCPRRSRRGRSWPSRNSAAGLAECASALLSAPPSH